MWLSRTPALFFVALAQVSELCQGFLQHDPSRRQNAADGLSLVSWFISYLESSAESRDQNTAGDDSAGVTAADAATAAAATATGTATATTVTATGIASTTTATTAAAAGVTEKVRDRCTATPATGTTGTAIATTVAAVAATAAAAAATTTTTAVGATETVAAGVGNSLHMGGAAAASTASAAAGATETDAVVGDGLRIASPAPNCQDSRQNNWIASTAASCQGLSEKRRDCRSFAGSGGGGGEGARVTLGATSSGDKGSHSSATAAAVNVKTGLSAAMERISCKGEDRSRQFDALFRWVPALTSCAFALYHCCVGVVRS